MERRSAISHQSHRRLVQPSAGSSPPTGLQFNFFSEELPPHLATEFELRGGHSPDINPRARILSGPVYRFGTEKNLATPEELAGSEFMQDFIYASGSADMCSMRLPDVGDTLVAAAVSRTSRQEFTAQGQQAFQSLMPHFSAALRLRATLDQDSARLAAGTMDAISCAAFVLDRGQNIVALSRNAEAMLAESTFLTARGASCPRASGATILLYRLPSPRRVAVSRC